MASSAGGGLHCREEVSGDVPLEAATDLVVGLLLAASPGQVVLGGFVAVDQAPVHDGVQGPVEGGVGKENYIKIGGQGSALAAQCYSVTYDEE